MSYSSARCQEKAHESLKTVKDSIQKQVFICLYAAKILWSFLKFTDVDQKKKEKNKKQKRILTLVLVQRIM